MTSFQQTLPASRGAFWIRISLIIALLPAACGMMGAQQPSGASLNDRQEQPVVSSHPGSPGLETADDYVISPNDVVEVYVVDAPEFSREYRVSSSGQIAIPLLPEPIEAAGLTLGNVSREIDKQLKKAGLITNPHVSLSVKESRLHSIAVTGAVKNPQIYPVFGHTRLLDLLSQAGGLSDNAGPTVKITRGGIAKQSFQAKDQPLNSADAALHTPALNSKAPRRRKPPRSIYETCYPPETPRSTLMYTPGTG